ncbi:RNA binding protein [Pseudohyphozyma bogoriensis]|nr:RNA binding protein [Pseudohyphozyma bogoriensis]
MSEEKLTKKQKKALAFRSGKGKKSATADAQDAVPEVEDLDSIEQAAPAEPGSSKKRKREDNEEVKEAAKEVQGEGGEDVPKKKKRQRGGKKKSLSAARGSEGRPSEVGEDGKPRLLLFVGNMPYSITPEDIVKHFEGCGEPPIVRLLTPKPNPDGTVGKSKGCAFLEFTLATSLQSALRLHHSELAGRKINVELTAGGGGNSVNRKRKIEDARKRITGERDKANENKKKRDEAKDAEAKEKRMGWKAGEAAEDEKKKKAQGEEKKVEMINGEPVRGKKIRDRRLKKVGADGQDKERARKQAAKARDAMTGTNNIPLGRA